MGSLTKEDFLKKVEATEKVKPDEWDLKMLAEIDAEKDDGTVPFEAVRAYRACSGKVSLRLPKELHYRLLENAKDSGVSLNQFIVYKLAK